MNVIVFNGEFGVAVVRPQSSDFDIKEIGERSVPHGSPFKVISEDEIPEDRINYIYPNSELSDGVGQNTYNRSIDIST